MGILGNLLGCMSDRDADIPTLVKGGALLIDVRTAGEYEYDGHIEGARLMPLSVLPVRLQEIPRDRTVVCVCRSGARSYTACELLQKQGFENVINLNGGMMGWKRARLPHK